MRICGAIIDKWLKRNVIAGGHPKEIHAYVLANGGKVYKHILAYRKNKITYYRKGEYLDGYRPNFLIVKQPAQTEIRGAILMHAVFQNILNKWF
jgi:hypothetical protein